jgi:hypothetical protein
VLLIFPLVFGVNLRGIVVEVLTTGAIEDIGVDCSGLAVIAGAKVD